MKQEDKTFKVSSVEQKIIFCTEMQGQISDGMWENASPNDHWVEPARLKEESVIVTGSEGVAGRNFYCIKENYNFSAAALLDIVGDRIINKIKFFRLFPEGGLDKVITNLVPDDLKIPTYEGKYWDSKRKAMADAGVTQELLDEVDLSECYTMTELKKDCSLLKKAFKKHIS